MASSGREFNNYEVRKGTVDHGGDYEYMICALLALNLYCDRNIKNFKISNNDNKLKKFDDVVVEINYENDEIETIAIQLKYISRPNKNFLQKDFKDKFNLEEHNPSKEIGHEYQNIKYLLYTNGVGDLDSIKRFVNKTYSYKIDVKVDNTNEEIFNRVCNEEGQNLRFSPISKDDKESGEKCEGFKEFRNLYFCINQYSIEKLKEKLQTILSENFKHFNTREMFENFYKFFELWSKIQNIRFKIQKSHIAFKLGIISLSQYVPSQNQQEKPIENAKHVKLLKEAFMIFNISICNTDSNLVSTIWKTDFTEIDKNDQRNIFLNLNDISQETLPLREKFLLLWIQNKAALVLDFKNECWETVKRSIQMCREYDPSLRFILSAPLRRADVADDFKNIWENLSDMKDSKELLDKIIQSFKLKPDQRGPFVIEQIFGSEISNLKAVTVGDCISSLETNVANKNNENPIKNYISRKIPRLVFKGSLDNITNDFVIVGCRKEFTHRNRKEVSLENFLSTPLSDKIKTIIITTRDSINNFSLIKEKCTSFYYFEEIDKYTLEWIASYKHSTLIQMEHDNSDSIDDTDFFEHFRNDINIILADPGMGKTVLMDFLFNICPANYWPIKVIVRQHFTFLKDPKNVDVNLIIDYLIKKIVSEKWQKYAKQLQSNGNFIIFWDGLDEYPSKCLDNLIKIISTLREHKFKQIVTSREFLKEKLEEAFKIRHLTILPIDEKEQIHFIEKSLDQTNYTEDEKIKIKKVILDSVGIKRYRDILGIPLQLYLYVEVYISKYFDKQVDINNLTNIYKQFINNKIKIAIEKGELNTRQAFNKKEYFKVKEQIKYQKAAIISKFDNNLCQTYKDELNEFFEDIRRGNFECGIIINFTDENQPLFFHEMVTEFLIASFLKENWQNPNERVKSFIYEVFSNWFISQYQTIRYFFDLLLARGHPLHILFLNQDYDKILQNKEDFNWNECDEGKRGVLHLVCGSGQKHPELQKNYRKEYLRNKFKLKIVKNYEKVLKHAIEKCDVQLKDNVLEMTGFEYALKTKSLFEIESILGENKSQGIEFRSLEQEQCQDYLMYYSILCNYYEILKRIKFSNIKLKDGYSLLHLASENRCQNSVEYLIKKGVDIDKTDLWRITPLHIAAEKGHLNIIISLIKNGANVNQCDEYGQSILHLAYRSGNLEMVKFLVEIGANINQCDKYGPNILGFACERGNLEMVKFLVERGADMNVCDKNGQSILHAAYRSGNFEVITFLVEIGSDINVCNKCGQSILHFASKGGNLEMVKFLVKIGADINVCDKYGQSILHLAAQRGNFEMIKFLVEIGADINVCNKYGQSILHFASKGGNLEMVQFLIKIGADINVCDKNGQSILHLTAQRGNLEIVKFLVEIGTDINVCNQNGQSILHWASRSGNVEIVKFFVDVGADIKVCEKNGESILHLASQNGSSEIVKFLVENGADINICDKLGQSIMHWASKSGNLKVVNYLVERGADINQCDIFGNRVVDVAKNYRHFEIVKFLKSKK